jgi:hypothetical protein
VSKKPESSKPKKQEERSAESRQEEGQEAADLDKTTIDSALAASGSDPDKLASFMDKADKATQERLVGRLQQTHGNLFVQRMLAQRQEAGEGTADADNAAENKYTPEEWQSWASAAAEGARIGADVFAASAYLTGVKIMGIVAVGGKLVGPSIAPMVFAQVMGAGAPAKVASAFAKAAGKAWQGWVSKVSVPGLPWYPAFAAYPGPMAPPMPNVPTPLMNIAPGASIDAGKVSSSILSSLGSLADEPGAQSAVNNFATLFSVGFMIWFVTKQVMNVMGKGPVPTFAPPYVPVAPVVMGDVLPTSGILI